jgi:hypothetical protein
LAEAPSPALSYLDAVRDQFPDIFPQGWSALAVLSATPEDAKRAATLLAQALRRGEIADAPRTLAALAPWVEREVEERRRGGRARDRPKGEPASMPAILGLGGAP